MKKFKMILDLANSNGKFRTFLFAALCLLSFQSAPAQQTPKPKKTFPTTKPKTPLPTTVTPPVVATPRPLPTPPPETKRVVVNEADTPAEKSIATESKITVSLCVSAGNVRINGWDRDEVRAYVADGSQVGFKVVQENPKNKKPVWIAVLGFDPKKNKEIKPEECLSGSEIELDVPRNTNIKLDSGESEVKIDSLARVSVKTLSGGIYLNNIANGVDATTYRGDLTVEKSGGQVVLNNTEGNIIALEVAPSEIGDTFKAKTNSGRIVLKAVEHRQVETGSISGSTSFDGELLDGGQYTFSTQNGSIGLIIPPTSGCKINATFGFGAFASEIPLQNILKKEQSLSAQIGTGETTCSVILKTGSGVIRIKSGKPASTEAKMTTKDSNKMREPANGRCPIFCVNSFFGILPCPPKLPFIRNLAGVGIGVQNELTQIF
ncbi:MAG TPA: hypothetical protein VGC97_12955 [Pyrinomonadaceae bacterium]|jgi:hypothetical protein